MIESVDRDLGPIARLILIIDEPSSIALDDNGLFVIEEMRLIAI